MLLDEILLHLGEFGPFQRRIYIIASLIAVFSAFHAFVPIFLNAEMDHWCSTASEEVDINCTTIGLGTDQCAEFIKNVTIPSRVENGKVVYEQCQRYNLTGIEINELGATRTNLTQAHGCDGSWTYDRSEFQATTVSEFNLVCDRKSLPNYANSAYFAGYLVGIFFFGNLADWIGRYITYFISVGLWFVSGIAMAFSPNFATYAAMRFLIGGLSRGTIVAYILGSEYVGPSKRAMAGNVIWLFFAGGYMLLAILAYFFRNWRHLQLVVSVPLALFIFAIPVLQESPRWLISRGKYDKVEIILRKASKVNKVDLPEVLFDEHEKTREEGAAPVGKPWDIFRTPNLRANSLNLFYNWFVNSMVYYGLALSTSGLGVNKYVAAFVSGAVEIPAYLCCWYFLDKFGRRLPLCIYMVGGGVACLISGLIPPGVARTVVAMIGKFGITASFSVVYVISNEIYPTPVRSIGMAMSSMCARISGIIAPLILILGDHWQPIPYLIFGANSILAGCLVLLLPETRGTNLPQTIEESEALGKNGKCTWRSFPFCVGPEENNYKPTPTSEDKSKNVGEKTVPI